ncbi:MAG: peptide-methionine (S)-S-oxide reductase MsrA [Candidatus Omnitrophica bacterium]|nr:peptide-methionine (S)-S-oxide reductase MsrA [Candidatus Omnitrophota bacterium]
MGRVEKATFAGGCFWCMQSEFDAVKGILSSTVGYTGSSKPNPTYEEVSTGSTGHAEAIEIEYDPAIVSYQELLDIFWRNIDPTIVNGQFADKGSQYRTAIFYHDEEQKRLAEASKQVMENSGKFQGPIVTEIVPAMEFYPAEDYHQKYYKKNSMRYQLYNEGSGRKSFLKKLWNDQQKK